MYREYCLCILLKKTTNDSRSIKNISFSKNSIYINRTYLRMLLVIWSKNISNFITADVKVSRHTKKNANVQ